MPDPSPATKKMITGGTAAAVADGKSVLFYVDDTKNHLRGLANKAEEDKEIAMESDEGRENYTDDIIRLNKVAVVCKSKDIAAISYEPPSQAGDKDLRTRVYFINEQGIVDEIGKNASKPWFSGTLKDLKCKAPADSPITALYSPKAASIKVYYYKAESGDRNVPWVAYWSYNDKKWATEPVISTV